MGRPSAGLRLVGLDAAAVPGDQLVSIPVPVPVDTDLDGGTVQQHAAEERLLLNDVVIGHPCEDSCLGPAGHVPTSNLFGPK